jgi:hypothetical protein
LKLLGRHDEKDNGSSKSDGPRSLFRHEVRYDGRAVVVLEAVATGDGVVVETEVFSIIDAPGAPPATRPFAFSTLEQARRFVEDALVSLEYLDCTVSNEPSVLRASRDASQPGMPFFADGHERD